MDLLSMAELNLNYKSVFISNSFKHDSITSCLNYSLLFTQSIYPLDDQILKHLKDNISINEQIKLVLSRNNCSNKKVHY